MTATTRPRTGGALVLGAILIVVGLVAVIGRSAGFDLRTVIGEQTWPLLVIVPGVVLFGSAFTRTPPDGIGLAIGGAIVTTVGAILLYQANTETWESWAYVWALIPGAAGLGKAAYGLATGSRQEVVEGGRMAVIAGLLFVAGWWYFGTLFETGQVPLDASLWWPIALIAARLRIRCARMYSTAGT